MILHSVYSISKCSLQNTANQDCKDVSSFCVRGVGLGPEVPWACGSLLLGDGRTLSWERQVLHRAFVCHTYSSNPVGLSFMIKKHFMLSKLFFFSATVKKNHVVIPFLSPVLHSRWLCVLCLAPLVQPWCVVCAIFTAVGCTLRVFPQGLHLCSYALAVTGLPWYPWFLCGLVPTTQTVLKRGCPFSHAAESVGQAIVPACSGGHARGSFVSKSHVCCGRSGICYLSSCFSLHSAMVQVSPLACCFQRVPDSCFSLLLVVGLFRIFTFL